MSLSGQVNLIPCVLQLLLFSAVHVEVVTMLVCTISLSSLPKLHFLLVWRDYLALVTGQWPQMISLGLVSLQRS